MMISSTTWSLTEMCGTHLKINREDIDPDDTHTFFDDTVSSPDRLIRFVRHCEIDAFFQMAIAAKVQIMPLTKQLTTLAGNSWYVMHGDCFRLCADRTFDQEPHAQWRTRRTQ